MAAGFSVKAKKKMKIERQCQSSAWSNLPDDLICLTMNRLYYVDQIRFRAVCKSWRKVNIQGVVKRADKLPWNMAIDSNSCHLYDPSHKRSYTIETSITRTGIFINARVLASKHGWVLFFKGQHPYFHKTNANLFFYNPFTNQIIQLPNLRMKINDKATFTISPDSQDCEIFIARAYYTHLSIRTCRPGDTKWTKLTKFTFSNYSFHENKFGLNPNYDIEYVNGVLYSCFDQTVIFTFNALLNKWKILRYPPDDDDDIIIVQDYLFESDGNLLICQDFDNKFLVFKLDGSQTKWIGVESLENRTLLLGHTSFYVPVDITSELVNTIHSDLCHQGGFQCSKISQTYDWDGRHLDNFWVQLPQLV